MPTAPSPESPAPRRRALDVLSAPAGRRAKFVVVGVWLVIAFALGPLAGKLEDAQKNDPASFLPANAESVKALETFDEFPSGETSDAVTVFRRAEGLTPEDRAAIARVRASLNRDRPPTAGPTRPAVVSPDGTTALLVTAIPVDYESDDVLDATNEIRDRIADGLPGGLEAAVTGPAGFATDAIEVFQSIDGFLLFATATLVFLLLIAIYRSPIFWVIPFFAVLLAEVTSRAMGYLLAEAGVTINGQTAGVLPVLVFGAGTDYALLLVARYREELRRHDDKHEAMRIALRRAGPAILASGATVALALLTLSLAEVSGTAGLGPVGAMGIALAVISMLTILPALLVIAGRRAFWPFIPRYGSSGADETHGFWRRVGNGVDAHPRRVMLGVIALLAVLALGLVQFNTDLTTGNSYRDDVQSVRGQQLVDEGFPAGTNAPTSVVVPDPARVAAVRAAVQRTAGVEETTRPELGPPGAKFQVVLDRDPYSTAAFDLIPEIRDVAKRAGGDDVLVGGPTAEERDLRVAAARDNRLIVPIVLVVVFLVLMVLLRAVLAPVVLIATVVASYAAALGLATFFFENVFDFAGLGPTLPLFALVFLVALGVDYNIFLMARVREEAQRYGTRQGMLRGLAVTGAVITSAGIVLAGTFSMLAVLPLVELTEIGFTIAVGVLLDALIVRSLLVPALTFQIGDRIWWPSALARRWLDRAPPPEPSPDGKEGAGPDGRAGAGPEARRQPHPQEAG